jgi:thymidylate kinase
MLIEITGIDGSGKSTQIDHLMRWFSEQGISSYHRIIRPVSRRVLGGIASEKGFKSWDEIYNVESVELTTALELYQLVYSTITPINIDKQVIITDTYIRNYLASAITRDLSIVNKILPIYQRIPKPDLSINLSINSKSAYERIINRPKGDHILRHGGYKRLERLFKSHEEVEKYLHYDTYTLAGELEEKDIFSKITTIVQDESNIL